ncbi:hypothetical protein QQS21_008845 [Conoideocrella luteorostrata]|uniref:Uncharacterized protein n=1 Tax=Conoideocrella luteorostrata TaxID=1105319 RepID=A0AAJ0FR14_9HYPO|nr:hypothetical protein QQS21_008845 [Conoideocrella luteorostrata]
MAMVVSDRTTKSEPPYATLHRFGTIVILTLVYVFFATFAWAFICLLTYKPTGLHGYSYGDADGQRDAEAMYQKSECYLRAARVLQSITSMLTIPLTSAVCSQAAVIFLQGHRHHDDEDRRGPTLRQAMALADKSWTDPVTLWKLIFKKCWKLYGSRAFAGALLLNLFGASISPFQGIFLSFKSIKVPSLGIS